VSQQQLPILNENILDEQHCFIVRFSSLGDVALSTGPMAYWNRTRNLRFTVLTRPEWAGLLKGHPAVAGIETCPVNQLSSRELIRAFRCLARKYKNVPLLDLQGSIRSRLLSTLWRGPVRRYKKYSFERRMFLWSGKKYYGDRLLEYNVPQRYCLALESVPPLREEVTPIVNLTLEEEQAGLDLLCRYRAFSELATYGKSNFPIIALHPYATHPSKTWPWKVWQEFTTILTQEGLPWFIIGSYEHSPLPYLGYGGVNFTNITDLRLTCSLLKQAAMLITGDSGPMHLATAVDTPVVAMFGPTTQHWGFFPEGEKHQIIELNAPNRPYSLHGKTHNREVENCMQGITIRSVFSVMMQILAKGG
jgi:ADP-heptose:LPS heptosyltransferase